MLTATRSDLNAKPCKEVQLEHSLSHNSQPATCSADAHDLQMLSFACAVTCFAGEQVRGTVTTLKHAYNRDAVLQVAPAVEHHFKSCT